MKKSCLVGERFGSLTVVSYSHSNNGKYWTCVCDCGKTKTTNSSRLNEGKARSCGCLLKKSRDTFSFLVKTHGKSDHELFRVWQDILRRCYDHRVKGFENYGGRGITVCKRWRVNFAHFLEDMGERPPGLTVERVNTLGPYSKENCVWATRAEQNRNSRRSKLWHIHGVVYRSAYLASKAHGVCRQTIMNWCKKEELHACYSENLYGD